jgi:hypothetical protein
VDNELSSWKAHCFLCFLDKFYCRLHVGQKHKNFLLFIFGCIISLLGNLPNVVIEIVVGNGVETCMFDIKSPKVFISYSWDDVSHKSWVKELASHLRSDGVDVTIDRWGVAPGGQLPEYMERSIRENDYVLIVCTPQYKSRSDNRSGGVGYEGDIMTGEVFVHRNHSKFIPLLRRGE